MRMRWLLGERLQRLLSRSPGLPGALILDLASILFSGTGWRYRLPENDAEENTLSRWVYLMRLSDFQRACEAIHRNPKELPLRLFLAVSLFTDEHYRSLAGLTSEMSPYPLLSPLSLFFVENADAFESDARRIAALSLFTVSGALPRRYIRLRLTTPEGLEEAVVLKATHFPLGGYSELTTTGTLESIVPTELLTYSELPDYFDYKLINGQLLYFARDTESEALILKQSLVVFASLPEEMYQGIVNFNGLGHLPARIVQGVLHSLTLSLLPQTQGRVRLEWCLAGPESDEEKEWLSRIFGRRVLISAIRDLKTSPREITPPRGKFVAALVLAPDGQADAVKAYATEHWDTYRAAWFSEALLHNPAVLYREAERALTLL